MKMGDNHRAFNFSKVKSYTYDSLEGLSDHFDQCERQFPAEKFDDKIRILVLASPAKFQALAEDAVESYCDEWGLDKHQKFREFYGEDADIYDLEQGERVFLTPYKKKATRLLDGNDEPNYEIARGRILGAVLGSEGVDELEYKLKKGQGSNSVRGYVAEFQGVVKTLQQLLHGAIDQRRYARHFLKGLNPSVKQFIQIPEKGEENLVVLYEAAKAAAARTSLLGEKDSSGSTTPAGRNQGQDKFQVHPARKQLMFSPGIEVVSHPLFPEIDHLTTNASDPIVGAFVYGLNAVTASGEYLRMVADAGRIRLDDTATLMSSKADITVLHSALRGALKNISSAAQLEKVLQACFPRQFRVDRTEPLPRHAPSAPVVKANETLAAVQGELLNFKNDIFERLKEAQKSNAREQSNMLEQNNRAQNNILERINAVGHSDRTDRRGGSRDRGEDSNNAEPSMLGRVLERLNALQQSTDANKRKWDTAFEDRNRRSREEERRESRGSRGEKCHNCNKEGHRKLDCPELKPRSNGEGCRFCKETSHQVADCSKLRDHICKECGKKGHSKIWCTPRECMKCNKKHSPLNGCAR